MSHHTHAHGHSHGLIDPSIKRSRAGLRAVGISLAVLGVAAVAQAVIFALTDSVALLADLIHNFGDASTAIPVGVAFLLRSERAERIAGLFVVAEREGRRMRYRLHDDHVAELLAAVRHHHEHASRGWSASAPARGRTASRARRGSGTRHA